MEKRKLVELVCEATVGGLRELARGLDGIPDDYKINFVTIVYPLVRPPEIVIRYEE